MERCRRTCGGGEGRERESVGPELWGVEEEGEEVEEEGEEGEEGEEAKPEEEQEYFQRVASWCVCSVLWRRVA